MRKPRFPRDLGLPGVAGGAWALCVCVSLGCTKVMTPPPPAVEAVAAAPVAAAPAPVATWRPSASSASAPQRPVPPPPRPLVAAAPVRKDAGPPTLNGDPNGLRQDDLQRVLDGVLPSLASCFTAAGSPPGAGLSFDAEASGHTRNIKVSGAPPEIERCVAGLVGAVRLPEFQGASVPVQFPITIYRPAPPAVQAGSPAGTPTQSGSASPGVGSPSGAVPAAPAAAAPIFLKP